MIGCVWNCGRCIMEKNGDCFKFNIKCISNWLVNIYRDLVHAWQKVWNEFLKSHKSFGKFLNFNTFEQKSIGPEKFLKHSLVIYSNLMIRPLAELSTPFRTEINLTIFLLSNSKHLWVSTVSLTMAVAVLRKQESASQPINKGRNKGPGYLLLG